MNSIEYTPALLEGSMWSACACDQVLLVQVDEPGVLRLFFDGGEYGRFIINFFLEHFWNFAMFFQTWWFQVVLIYIFRILGFFV